MVHAATYLSDSMTRSFFVCVGILLLSLVGTAQPTRAQNDQSPQEDCTILCAPDVEFEPTVAVEPLFGGPRVQNLRTGEVTEEGASATFEIVIAVGMPTTLPRVELTGEAIWAPFAETDANPFTGRSTDELSVEAIGENPVELEMELNVALLTPEETGGWLDAHVDVVDQFSPAEQPDDTRLYTHKLNLELDVALLPFHQLNGAGYLRHVELEGSLDYLATGLPHEGDRLGEERFLDDANPWGFSAVLVLPIAPLEL